MLRVWCWMRLWDLCAETAAGPTWGTGVSTDVYTAPQESWPKESGCVSAMLAMVVRPASPCAQTTGTPAATACVTAALLVGVETGVTSQDALDGVRTAPATELVTGPPGNVPASQDGAGWAVTSHCVLQIVTTGGTVCLWMAYLNASVITDSLAEPVNITVIMALPLQPTAPVTLATMATNATPSALELAAAQ